MFGNFYETKIFNVNGMHCEHCSAAVKKAVESLKGVKYADVSLTDATVSVQMNPRKVSCDEVVYAISAAGFEASPQ